VQKDVRVGPSSWGRDVAGGPNVAAAHQNLSLLVDRGSPPRMRQRERGWGAVLPSGSYTSRSWLGVTSAGQLVYTGGAALDAGSLGRPLIAAEAMGAMELLDTNPQ
jgi:hypothetical protein